MVSISAIFTSTNYTKQLNPWTNSSASHVANYSWLCACQGRGNHLKATWALMDGWQSSEISHSKSSLGNLQYQCLPELLYSYRLMENLLLCAWKVDFLNTVTNKWEIVWFYAFYMIRLALLVQISTPDHKWNIYIFSLHSTGAQHYSVPHLHLSYYIVQCSYNGF